jgi:hypothetical protein
MAGYGPFELGGRDVPLERGVQREDAGRSCAARLVLHRPTTSRESRYRRALPQLGIVATIAACVVLCAWLLLRLAALAGLVAGIKKGAKK